MKYYSRKCINYSRDRKITCGNEILLAGIQYYSQKWIITRGKKYYSRERIITRGNLFITRGNDILLAGEKYWQYMAPEGFRTTYVFNQHINVDASNNFFNKWFRNLEICSDILIGLDKTNVYRKFSESSEMWDARRVDYNRTMTHLF